VFSLVVALAVLFGGTSGAPKACMPFTPVMSQCTFDYQGTVYNLTEANSMDGDYSFNMDDYNVYFMQPCMPTIQVCSVPYLDAASACYVNAQDFTQTVIGLYFKQSGPMTPPARYNDTDHVPVFTIMYDFLQYTTYITFFCENNLKGDFSNVEMGEHGTEFFFEFTTQYVC